MYGESVTGNREKVIQLITEFRRDRTRLCHRAEAGVNVLKSHPLVNGRLAAVGYCFGNRPKIRASLPMALQSDDTERRGTPRPAMRSTGVCGALPSCKARPRSTS